MKLPADVLYFILLIAGIAGFRRRGDRAMLLVAVVGAGALALDGLKLPSVGVQLGVLEGALAVATVAVVIYVQGLPPGLARHIGIGRRSREWEFDRNLHRCRRELDAVLLSYPSVRDWPNYRRWQARVLRDGTRLMVKMKRLTAPDDGWAGIRDDYVDLYSGILALIAHDELPDDDYTAQRGLELRQRADILRLKYRASADAIMGRR